MILVRPRQDGVLYHIDVGKDGEIVLLTSDERHANGGDYFLEETSVSELPLPARSTMTQSSPLDDQGYFVEDMDLFRTHIVLYERSRESGEQRVRLRQRENSGQDRNVVPKETILAHKKLVHLCELINSHPKVAAWNEANNAGKVPWF